MSALHRTARVALAITLADGKAPTEFRLFTADLVTTSKGDFVFDKKASTAVLAAWAERGNDLPIDYDHAMVDPTTRPQDRGAAGWFKLELRGGELWAVDVRWTAEGERAVASGEWRFTSPAFSYDAESRRISELINVAITNLPATKNMDPLVAIHALDRRVALSAAASFEDVTRAVDRALVEAFDDCAWLIALYDDRAIYSCRGRIWSVGYVFDGVEASLVGDPVEVRADWQPLTTATLAASSGTHGAQPKKDAPMKIVLTTLSLPENASEADAVVALTKLQADARALLSLTGKQTVAEATAVVEAWKANSEALSATNARLAEIEKEREASAHDALMKRGVDEGKITAANREKVAANFPTAAALSAFLEVAVALPNAPKKPAPASTLGGKTFAELSTAEKHRLANDDPDTYAALKAAHNPAR